MELKYVKLLKGNNMSESSLSGKVTVGIRKIKEIQRGIELSTKNGRKTRQDVYDTLEFLDDSVSSIIQSQIDIASASSADEAKKAEAAKKAEEAELAKKLADEKAKDDKKDDNVDEVKPGDPKADKIDEDCSEALKAGKNKVSLEELKSLSKTAYDIIFNGYEPNGQNGVETSHYTILETEKETFTISKV